MLDYRINTFIKLCETLNYTKAAALLHITQPAVSQHIKYLENYYGIKLFQRNGKKLILTPQGEKLKQGLILMQENEYLLERNLHDVAKETIRFGATMSVGAFMLGEHLADYMIKHPQANIQVRVSNTVDLLNDLKNGVIDFAMLEGDYKTKDFNSILYRSMPFITVAGKAIELATITSIHDLVNYPLIIRESGSGTRKIMEKLLNDNHLSVSDFKQVIEVGNMQAIKKLVELNSGITCLYESVVSEQLKQGTIIKLPFPQMHTHHDISIVWNQQLLFNDYETLIREMFFNTDK